MFRIPIYQPDLSGNEKKYVNECLDSTWISSKGRFIECFESEFSSYTGAKHATAVCNGTVALHLALVALGIGPNDEVIVPSFTYIASVNAIHYSGATPVFADSDPASWQIDIAQVRQLITPRTKAVMAVHLYGGACDMQALCELCSEQGLKLIEDCAESFGTRIDGRHTGTFGDIGTFSFFGNKTLTTGEGGMLICRDSTLDAKIRHLRGQGLAPNREYWHTVVGYNYRMTNICAAIGLAQLERADTIIAAKSRLAERYTDALADLPYFFQHVPFNVSTAHWMVTILTENTAQRDPLREHLKEVGIETRPAFHPVHTMPMYAPPSYTLPVAMNLSARGINLPSWPNLSETEFNFIIGSIRSFKEARQ
jgi:perosamine synthetase